MNRDERKAVVFVLAEKCINGRSSSSAVNLAFSCLLKAGLLSFDAARVVLKHVEILKRTSCLDIIGLECFRDSGDARLGLACCATT